jgi:hypothetical protein
MKGGCMTRIEIDMERYYHGITLEELQRFVNSLKEGDKIELTSENWDGKNMVKEAHIWTIKKKYRRVMLVERRVARGYLAHRGVQYKKYYIERNQMLV